MAKFGWETGKSRWRKKYKGRVFTSPKCLKSSKEAREQAQRDFEKFRARIDLEQETSKPYREDYESAIYIRELMLRSVEREIDFQKTEMNQEKSIVSQLVRGLYAKRITAPNPSIESQESVESDENGLIDILDGAKPFHGVERENLIQFLNERIAKSVIDKGTESIETGSVNPSDQDEKVSQLLVMIFGTEAEKRNFRLKALNQQKKLLQCELKQLKENFSKKNPPQLDTPESLPVNPIQGQSLETFKQWSIRLSEQERIEQQNRSLSPSETIAGNIESYLRAQRSRLELGEITVSTYSSIQQRIDHFKTYTATKNISDLNEKLVSEYQESLQEKIKAAEYSPQHAQNLFNAAKAFANWLYDEGVIENPLRNLRKRKIYVPPPIIQTIDKDTLKRLLSGSSEKTRLYILLMMNTGYTQKDVSDLLQSEVDWKEGYIERKRSKTRNHKNVPVVRYILWDETFTLLKKHRSTSSERVLLSQEGTELVRKNIKADGKVTPIDVIHLAITRAKKKLEIKGRVKDIRKTSASELEKHSEHSRFGELFLGHSPSTIKDRHYSRYDQEGFERAVMWLGEQFDQKTERNLKSSTEAA